MSSQVYFAGHCPPGNRSRMSRLNQDTPEGRTYRDRGHVGDYPTECFERDLNSDESQPARSARLLTNLMEPCSPELVK